MDILGPQLVKSSAVKTSQSATTVDQLNPAGIKRIRDAATGFETALLRQMLREIRSSSIDPFKGTASSNYLSMVDDQMAETISKGGGMGFGKAMADQLIAQLKARDLINSIPKSVNTRSGS